MTILTLASDPTLVATAGAQTQYGTFGGKLYQHATAATDTNWAVVTSLVGAPLGIVALTANPLVDGAEGKQGQLGTWGGGLYQSMSTVPGAHTNWLFLSGSIKALDLNAATIIDLSTVAALAADPNVGPGVEGQAGKLGTWAGGLYMSLQTVPGAHTLWVNLTTARGIAQGLGGPLPQLVYSKTFAVAVADFQADPGLTSASIDLGAIGNPGALVSSARMIVLTGFGAQTYLHVGDNTLPGRSRLLTGSAAIANPATYTSGTGDPRDQDTDHIFATLSVDSGDVGDLVGGTALIQIQFTQP